MDFPPSVHWHFEADVLCPAGVGEQFIIFHDCTAGMTVDVDIHTSSAPHLSAVRPVTVCGEVLTTEWHCCETYTRMSAGTCIKTFPELEAIGLFFFKQRENLEES